MRRSVPSGPRGVLEVDWPFFGEICRALALRVARDYEPEIVLGIAKAGVIPGVVVASIMQCEFSSMTVTRRDDGSEPVLVSGPPTTIRGRRILVVDETCDTGSTMRLALSEVRALKPAEVRTAVSFKTGEYTPDYHAFETESFIILPWDREIIQGGELIVRPDYAARMEGRA
ncbi:MAG TPA: phosphoribosyltransferase family protein [Gemmatimonadales bacterium]|jgi:hypoxanthine phosphoribosyltransferase|nr:phosphoribosyltransferase family protein [Gemmatimonadales bacterium]